MEKLDKERYLKRVIIVCWIALAICFGIKLFGGNLFEIMCENENFIKVCEYADNHFWAFYIISASYCYVSLYFLELAMIGKWKYSKSELIIFTATILIGIIVKSQNIVLSLLYDVWQGVLMPIVFTRKDKKRFWFVLLGNALLVVFQLISMFIKNIHVGWITQNGTLCSAIFSIDVLLMIVLYYLYSNIKKEKE